MNRRKFLGLSVGTVVAGPALGLGYGLFEATWVHVDRHTIAVPNLPSPFEGMTVAVLSDMHHSKLVTREYLDSVVQKTNALKPDLVAIPGDFVHTSPGHRYVRPCIASLSRLQAPLGVYAVPGNHDHWDNVHVLHACLRDSPITDLTNAGLWVERCGQRVRVAGVDDLWEGKQDLDAALGDARPNDCCLLLAHNPDYVETLCDRRVSLALSGHLHGGQVVLPLVGYRRLPSKYGSKYVAGLVKTPYTQVFVSRGLGVSSVPVRFRCRPEINLLTLTRDSDG
jgi:predicted MPP superfamily phosphohydrolase